MRSNCIIFAVALWWRRRGRKRYVLVRGSHWGPFPHVLYCEGRHIVHYVPSNPRHKTCPPPLFSGRVKWGDR